MTEQLQAGKGFQGRALPVQLRPGPSAAALCSLAEMDGTGERVDQRRCEEVGGGAVEGHLPEVPLPEPHGCHDQGSLADHEETGDPLKLGAKGPSAKPPRFSFESWTGEAAVPIPDGPGLGPAW